MSVAGAIGDQNARLVSESRVLPVERINSVSPATMKNDERLAVATFAVINGDRLDAGGMSRKWQLESGHLRLPFPEKKPADSRPAPFLDWIHGPDLPTQDSRHQARQK